MTTKFENPLFTFELNDDKFSKGANEAIKNHIKDIHDLVVDVYEILRDPTMTNAEKYDDLYNDIDWGRVDVHKFGEQIRDNVQYRNGTIVFDKENIILEGAED